MNHSINKAILFNKREKGRDLERCNAVDTGQEGLRDLLDVLTVQLARVDAASDCGAKVIETTIYSLWLLIVWNLFRLPEATM
jgi:hypothetical protein